MAQSLGQAHKIGVLTPPRSGIIFLSSMQAFRMRESTHQTQMIKHETRLRPRIQEPLLPIFITTPTRNLGCLTDDTLASPVNSPTFISDRWHFTGCFVPGISTVMNCPKLYSRSADLTPACRASSSEIMLRTSTVHQSFQKGFVQNASYRWGHRWFLQAALAEENLKLCQLFLICSSVQVQ